MNRYNRRTRITRHERSDGEYTASYSERGQAAGKPPRKGWKWLAAAVLVLGIGVAGFLLREQIAELFRPEPEPVTITALDETDPEYAAVRFAYLPKTYGRVQQTLSGSVCAVSLIEGKDFCASDEPTLAEAKKEIDKAVALAAELGCDCVWLPVTVQGDQVSLGSASFGAQLLTYATDALRGQGLLVGMNWSPMDGIDPTVPEDTKICLEQARRIAACAPDRVTLFDCGYAEGQGSFAAYAAKNLTVGFEVYKRGKISDFLRQLTGVLTENGSTAVGLGVDPVWRTDEHDADGISVESETEDYSDACADTAAWVRSGIFAYVSVRNYGSLSDEEQPFKTVFKWWAALTEEVNIPMFTIHAGDRVAGSRTGWKLYDQLPKQVVEIRDLDGYGGSIINGVAKLLEYGEIRNVLSQTFQGKVDGDDILRTLTITAPKKKTYTTYDKIITLSGSSDPNFSVTINGEVIERTSKGYFSLNYDLDVGTNKFVISHKGTSVTYTVEREVLVIKSYAPTETLTVYAGTPVVVNCVALTGSTVYAKIDGEKVKMEEQAIEGLEDTAEQNSDYSSFVGTYVIPENSKSRTISGIRIYADWEGYKMDKECAKIKVKEVDTSVRVATAVSDYVEVFRGSTVDDKSVPTEFPMPKGTQDYVIGEVTYPFTDSDGTKHVYVYYKLKTGKRVYKSKDGELTGDVSVKAGGNVAVNEIGLCYTEVSEQYTEISFRMSSKVPFDLTLSPVSYKDAVSTDPSFAIDSFAATTVTLTFHNTKGVPELPLPKMESTLFSSVSKWKNSGTDWTLTFTLAKKGGFYGVYCSYDDNVLTFSFVNPATIRKASNSFGYRLDGVTIMLDPGHGGNSSGAVGANPNYPEKRLNLDVATYTRELLESLGARVIMTRSTDSTLSLEARVALCNKYKPNLFISIHHNYASAVSARGTDSFYFMPFSKPLANAIYSQLGAYYRSTIYPGDSNTNYLRNCQYYPFHVTRHWFAPSTLVEYGFVSNSAELQKLIMPSTQQDFARATVKGIVDYFKTYGIVADGPVTPSEPSEPSEPSTPSEPEPYSEESRPASEETESSESSKPTESSEPAASSEISEPSEAAESSASEGEAASEPSSPTSEAASGESAASETSAEDTSSAA